VFISLYPHEIIANSTLDVSLALGGFQIISHAANEASYPNIHVGLEPRNVDKKIQISFILFCKILQSFVFAWFYPLGKQIFV
jgi:hypothetical protein